MVLPAFNGETLKNQLKKFDDKRRLAFGAVCCERLLPNYLAFKNESEWGDLIPIRRALDLVWSYLQGSSPNPEEVTSLIAACESVAPHSEDFDSLYVTAAQDACFAVCSLLDYVLGSDIDKIVQVATYATNSVDLYVQEIENMDANTPDLGQRILTHQLMQRELAQQEKDLQSIKIARSLNSDFLFQLKKSWDNNGRSNLDLP